MPRSNIEIYGLGEWQRVRDEVTYVCQTVEKMTHASHDVADKLDALTAAVECSTNVLEEIRDELKKQRELLERRRS